MFFLLPLTGLPILYFSPHSSLDVRLFYQHEDAMNLLGSLSAYQKNSYITGLCFDLAYVAVYSAIFYLLLGKKGFIPGILDLIENFSIILYLTTGNEIPRHLGVVSGFKWISGAVLALMCLKELVVRLRSSQKEA